MAEYTNRLGKQYIFTRKAKDKILMEGDFNGVKHKENSIAISGGPFIKTGQMLSHIIYDTDFNVIVDSVEPTTDGGYIIYVRENKVEPDDYSHLDDRNIIGGII